MRHNLSLNKCFAKVDNPKLSQGAKKGCLWALNPAKVSKMEDEISKWGKKDPVGLLSSMAYPGILNSVIFFFFTVKLPQELLIWLLDLY